MSFSVNNKPNGKIEAIHIYILPERESTNTTEPEPGPSGTNLDPVFKVPLDENGEIVTKEPEPTVEVNAHNDVDTESDDWKRFKDYEKRLWGEKFVPGLVRYLKDFDAQEEERVFNQGVYDCKVCFSEKLGSDCIRFHGKGFGYYFYIRKFKLQ